MTSRLDEVRHGLPDPLLDSAVDDGGGDIEGGLDEESERLMTRFNREGDAIRNVLDWSRETVGEVDRSFAVGQPSASPERLAEAGAKLDQVEEKLAAVRRRLKRIAGENKDFKRDHAGRTAVVRTRVVQYKQMGERFIDVTKGLEAVRGKHREALERSVRQDVMRANPAMTARDADDAMAAGDRGLEQAMVQDRADTAELRYQVQDVKNRNAEIGKLTRNMAELNAMFVDMGILVDGQQELLNNIEYNVEEVKETTQKATEELKTARAYQKSKKKKKCICCVVIILICIAAAAAVLIPVGRKLGWFDGIGGGNNNNNNSNNNNNNNANANARRQFNNNNARARAAATAAAPAQGNAQVLDVAGRAQDLRKLVRNRSMHIGALRQAVKEVNSRAARKET